MAGKFIVWLHSNVNQKSETYIPVVEQIFFLNENHAVLKRGILFLILNLGEGRRILKEDTDWYKLALNRTNKIIRNIVDMELETGFPWK